MQDRSPFPFVLIAIPAALCGIAFPLPSLLPNWRNLSTGFLVRQDQWLLLGQCAMLAIACLGLRCSIRALALPRRSMIALTLAILVFCILGHRWILCGYDLSRDEQMAVFDSRIFAGGRLVEPLPALWQAHASALNLLFMLPVTHPAAWVSAYLPMNAMLRALVGLVDASWTGPIMTGLGVPLLWLCARSLWPQDREPAAVAILLYVTSGQILFAGMTAYAMPAHLTLDLLWLWLFLCAKSSTDIGAIAVGAVATGLHQPLFHPLFALPFLVGLVHERAWKRVCLYVSSYVAICAFWLMWPMAMRSLVAGTSAEPVAIGTDYLSRLVATVGSGDAARVGDMAGNLLRFAAWQPVLLIPLMSAGIVLARRERLTLAMGFSVVLPIATMSIILPYQGHGFGYRYLHGVLGPAILLAAQGYRYLVARDARLRALLLRTTLGSLLVVLPLQAYFAHAFYAPPALVDARLRASAATVAIIGVDDAPFALDLVLNRPDLSNRPLRLLASQIDDNLIAALCRSNTKVALPTSALFKPIDDGYGIASSNSADARIATLSPRVRAAGCSVELLAP